MTIRFFVTTYYVRWFFFASLVLLPVVLITSGWEDFVATPAVYEYSFILYVVTLAPGLLICLAASMLRVQNRGADSPYVGAMVITLLLFTYGFFLPLDVAPYIYTRLFHENSAALLNISSTSKSYSLRSYRRSKCSHELNLSDTPLFFDSICVGSSLRAGVENTLRQSPDGKCQIAATGKRSQFGFIIEHIYFYHPDMALPCYTKEDHTSKDALPHGLRR